MALNKKCPEIREAGEEESGQLRRLFKTLEDCPGFIRVGPAGYLFSVKFEPEIENIYNIEVRPTDTFIVTFPRSGTTWTQEIVWLLLNDLDYAKAASLHIVERFVNIGTSIWGLASRKTQTYKEIEMNKEDRRKFEKVIVPGCELLAAATDPRFIKSHLPLSMLPPNLIETAKVVYVGRDPRDLVVSLYHFSRLISVPLYTGDFKTFWNMYMNDNVVRAPHLSHVKEAWDLRNHPNMLFLFYEELKQDLPGTIKRIAIFFNKTYTGEQISGLCKHVHIDNFRNNDSVNVNFLSKVDGLIPGEEPFIRKGKVGGWRDYFDEEMTKECERWMAKKVEETGIQFPTYP
ncbi:sulfotransferase 1B1 isoform X1 [Bombyx mori]|uniref:sulfotransferase 1B1 isoform X1 n=1 Tax=Bombyx mori TaxID=7091 RepID=UPI002ED2B347